MKTLLVPVDFSATCNNALNYAADFAADIKADRIVLFKSFYVSIYAQLLPSADFVQLSADDVQRERDKISGQLDAIREQMQQRIGFPVEINVAISELPLLRAVHEAIDQVKPGIVIAGSERAGVEESYIASELIAIAKSSPVPVLIVPSDAEYKPVSKVLIPVDLKTIEGLQLFTHLNLANPDRKPDLLILNIGPNGKQSSFSEEVLNEVLKGYHYTVHEAGERDQVSGILNFARQNNAQLVVALPGKHSFFYNLTHRDITEALALNAGSPVLILK